MGKGDQRSKRGKIFRGTFGKTRPKRKKAPEAPAARGAKTARKAAK
ncbi:MAG TPA: 30S ribosomal protein THX [Deltaproteobacteria bacterium]|nr:30S ribosomal protein THX [Deltaproteobacteria bacterium]HOM28329.1 30S ribosomal protein THX [Deltaproteobacteria bacterium]HPP79332.1 30S ribosomal protein THX [Deltaproteobacteria bacterium]